MYISYIYGTISGHHGHCFENMMDHDFPLAFLAGSRRKRYCWSQDAVFLGMVNDDWELTSERWFFFFFLNNHQTCGSNKPSRNVGCNKPSKHVMWDLYQQRCVIWFAYT